jgi:hypothetical protein
MDQIYYWKAYPVPPWAGLMDYSINNQSKKAKMDETADRNRFNPWASALWGAWSEALHPLWFFRLG